VVDEWLTGLPGADFEAALPLLRRAVAEFSPAERRMLGDRVRGTAPGASAGSGGSGDWDEALAGRLVEHVQALLAGAAGIGAGAGSPAGARAGAAARASEGGVATRASEGGAAAGAIAGGAATRATEGGAAAGAAGAGAAEVGG
jgi:hypothetical protein